MNRNDIRDGTRLLIGVALCLVLGVAIWFGTTMFRKHTADFRGSAAQTEKVQANGAYRIAAYDSFFNQCAEIQGKEATVTALQEERKTNPPADRVNQINATITAVTASRATAIAHYNADASKSGTQAQFLSSTLPFQIDPTQEKTTCVIR